MIRCDFCKHRDKDGHSEPCIGCVECGVPYVEDTDRELEDFFEEIEGSSYAEELEKESRMLGLMEA